MKRLLALTLTLVMVLALAGSPSASAATARFSSTQEFMDYCDSEGYSYDYIGVSDDGARERVVSSWYGDNIDDLDVVLSFDQDLETVNLFAWNIIDYAAFDYKSMLEVVNELNAQYYWVKFYCDTTDNSITGELSVPLRAGYAGPLALDALTCLVDVIDDAWPQLEGWSIDGAAPADDDGPNIIGSIGSSAPPAATPAGTGTPAAQLAADALYFSTTDRNGNSWDQSCFLGAKLTMINFWEPWCGPCIREMPDLQRLYEDYGARGFQILGVYSTGGQEGEVDTVLQSTGVEYPILHYVQEFAQFDTGYVPTTIFVDGQGRVVGETLVGSRSYAAWAEVIEGLLN